MGNIDALEVDDGNIAAPPQELAVVPGQTIRIHGWLAPTRSIWTARAHAVARRVGQIAPRTFQYPASTVESAVAVIETNKMLFSRPAMIVDRHDVAAAFPLIDRFCGIVAEFNGNDLASLPPLAKIGIGAIKNGALYFRLADLKIIAKQ